MTVEELIEFAEVNRITVDYRTQNAKGFALKLNKEFFVSINCVLEKTSVLHREILAHEMAHCIIDNFYLIRADNPLSLFNVGYYEREAKDFCVKWLIPFHKLKRSIKENVYSDGGLWHVQEDLGVSKELLDYAIEYYTNHGEELPTVFHIA